MDTYYIFRLMTYAFVFGPSKKETSLHNWFTLIRAATSLLTRKRIFVWTSAVSEQKYLEQSCDRCGVSSLYRLRRDACPICAYILKQVRYLAMDLVNIYMVRPTAQLSLCTLLHLFWMFRAVLINFQWGNLNLDVNGGWKIYLNRGVDNRLFD